MRKRAIDPIRVRKNTIVNGDNGCGDTVFPKGKVVPQKMKAKIDIRYERIRFWGINFTIDEYNSRKEKKILDLNREVSYSVGSNPKKSLTFTGAPCRRHDSRAQRGMAIVCKLSLKEVGWGVLFLDLTASIK
jgi:hypothetical protein